MSAACLNESHPGIQTLLNDRRVVYIIAEVRRDFGDTASDREDFERLAVVDPDLRYLMSGQLLNGDPESALSGRVIPEEE